MFQIRIKVRGLFGYAKQTASKRRQGLAVIVKSAQVQAFTEYATGRLRPSLRDRLMPAAFGVYGFKKREAKYQRRQIKVLGTIRPYYSPRRPNLLKVTQAIVSGKALAIVRATQDVAVRQAHMADILRRPGSGYNVVSRGKTSVKTRLTLPGAKILNKLGSTGAIYRAQLLDLTLGGGRDAKAIMSRIDDIVGPDLVAAIQATPESQLRLT